MEMVRPEPRPPSLAFVIINMQRTAFARGQDTQALCSACHVLFSARHSCGRELKPNQSGIDERGLSERTLGNLLAMEKVRHAWWAQGFPAYAGRLPVVAPRVSLTFGSCSHTPPLARLGSSPCPPDRLVVGIRFYFFNCSFHSTLFYIRFGCTES